MHGEYRYLTKSRFLDEIPPEYLNTGKNSYSQETYKKPSFTNKDNATNNDNNYTTSFGKDFTANNYQKTFGSSNNNDFTTGFGKDFIAPVIKRNKEEKLSKDKPIEAKKIIISKDLKQTKTPNDNNNNQDNKNRNPQAKKITQKTVKKELTEGIKIICKEQISKTKKTEKDPEYEVFKAGDKVYHQRFGSGYIENTIKISENIIYSVIFEQSGKRALDAQSAKLKRIDVPSKLF